MTNTMGYSLRCLKRHLVGILVGNKHDLPYRPFSRPPDIGKFFYAYSLGF